MNAIDRLGHQFIGAPCEVLGCGFSVECGTNWDGKPDLRCHEHSINRLIDALLVSVPCQFRAVDCTTHSSKVNEHNVHMCETCYNVYRRFQHRANRDIEYNIAVEHYVAILRRENEEREE